MPPSRARHFAELANAWRGRMPLTYRRREVNTGFKAGNIRDFCDRWGRAARPRSGARRRQPDDRRRGAASGAHHAGQPAARHSAKPGHRHAIDQRVCAHLPVRHAARHALLHHRQRLVAGRLRTLLGSQRDRADRAVHDALPSAGARQGRAHCRPRSQPRPGRSGADAARRLRGARAAGGRRRASSKIRRRCSNSSAGICAGARATCSTGISWRLPGLKCGQPLPARLRAADVPGLAGLDRTAGVRLDRGRVCGSERSLHPRPTPAFCCSASFW